MNALISGSDSAVLWSFLTRKESPFKIAVRGGMEGEGNFKRHYTGFIEVPAQWEHKAFRLHAAPIAVFNSRSRCGG